MTIVQRISSAWHALTAKRSTGGGYSSFSDAWVPPSVGLWARAFQEIGLRHNHGAMVGMCVQWVGICSAFNAVQRAGAVIRAYRKSGARGTIGKYAGTRVTDKRRIKYLRDRRGASGAKASQYAEMGGDVDELHEHPILDLLHKPNPWMGGIEYERRLARDLEVPGNGYERFMETGDSIQLLPMPAAWTRVQTDANTLIRGYKFGADEASMVRYDPDVVIHHREMPAIDNLYYGTSALRNILSETSILAMAIDYETNAMVNGVRPSNLAFLVDEDTADPQIDQIRAYLQQRYSGPSKSGMPLVLRGIDAKMLNRTAVEMEFREGIEYVRQMTLASYGIPDALIMRSSGKVALSQSGSTQDSAYENYAKFTLTPKIASVLELRNDQLVRLMGFDPGEVFLGCDDPCPPSREELREDAKVLVPVGVIEANEAREALSLDPHPDGEGLRFQGKTFETMDRPPPEPMANGGEGKSGDKGNKAQHSATGAWWKSPVWRESFATKDDDYRSRPVTMTVRELESNLLAWFKGVHPTVVQSPDLTTGGVALKFGPAEEVAFARAVTPPLSAVSVLGFNRAVADLVKEGRLPATMDKITALSGPAADRMAQVVDRLFKSVESSLSDHIRESLAVGIDNGETIGELTARVREIAGPGTENAAYTIARTESVRAFNTAREDGWKESGNVPYKRWVLSGNPCPVCRAMAAKFGKVPVGQALMGEGETIHFAGGTFTNDYVAMMAPPAHPHCACGLSAVFE